MLSVEFTCVVHHFKDVYGPQRMKHPGFGDNFSFSDTMSLMLVGFY